MNLKVFPPDHDIVVYGATSGAVATAIQSAKLGRNVVFVSPAEHIGGVFLAVFLLIHRPY